MVHDPQRTGPPGEGQAAGERIAKTLARAGVASRREVERLIAAGRVALNGVVLDTPAVKVEPGDVLTVDGEVVGEAEPARLFRYHKPVGQLTSHSDPQGRPTVFEALPPGLPRLISVGRLDLNSEGLMLLTNDGGLARALERPESGVVRRYRARALGRVTQEKLDRLKSGVTVAGVRYGPIEARLDKVKEGPQGANVWISVTLSEGKNREVRRVLESLGLKVNRLIRLAYGPFALGTLGSGELEEVGPRVIREQLSAHISPENLPKGDRPQYRAPKSASPASTTRRAPAGGEPATAAPEKP
ncbi:MAG: pseudouridine synthase, partial [Phenylobacterium sp.]